MLETFSVPPHSSRIQQTARTCEASASRGVLWEPLTPPAHHKPYQAETVSSSFDTQTVKSHLKDQQRSQHQHEPHDQQQQRRHEQQQQQQHQLLQVLHTQQPNPQCIVTDSSEAAREMRFFKVEDPGVDTKPFTQETSGFFPQEQQQQQQQQQQEQQHKQQQEAAETGLTVNFLSSESGDLKPLKKKFSPTGDPLPKGGPPGMKRIAGGPPVERGPLTRQQQHQSPEGAGGAAVADKASTIGGPAEREARAGPRTCCIRRSPSRGSSEAAPSGSSEISSLRAPAGALAGGPLECRVGALIRSALERFETHALQRMEVLMQETWGPRRSSLRSETDLSMEVNKILLQSIHLEGLTNCELYAVLCLSEELRRYADREGAPTGEPARCGAPCECSRQPLGAEKAPSCTPAMSFQPPYVRRPLSRPSPMIRAGEESLDAEWEAPTDFVVTPRGSVREAGPLVHQGSLLDAIDERDGFLDILRVDGQQEPDGGGNGGEELALYGRSERLGRNSRSSSEVSKAAAAEAAAAVAAVDLTDMSRGNASPYFGPCQKPPRKRTRQGAPKRPGALRGLSLGPEERPGFFDAPSVKRHSRGAPLRRSAALRVPSETAATGPAGESLEALKEAPLGQRAVSSVEDGESFSPIPVEASCYKTQGAPKEAAGLLPHALLHAQGPRRVSTCECVAGNSNNLDRHSCSNPSGAPAAPGCPHPAAAETPVKDPPGAPELLASSLRSPVKGVYFDSFKKLWRVQWQAAGDPGAGEGASGAGGQPHEGRRMSRSFSCSRLGFEAARARAVAWMLSGGLVGEGGAHRQGKAGGRPVLNVSDVCTILETADTWSAVEDPQIKEFVVFYDPKKFLVTVEGYYVAKRQGGGHLAPAVFKGGPSGLSTSPIPRSIKDEESCCAGGPALSPSRSSEGALRSAPLPAARSGPLGGRKGFRAPFNGSRQRVMTPLSIDDMLEIVWGAPKEAAAAIWADAGEERPLMGLEASQQPRISPLSKPTPSTAGVSVACFVKTE